MIMIFMLFKNSNDLGRSFSFKSIRINEKNTDSERANNLTEEMSRNITNRLIDKHKLCQAICNKFRSYKLLETIYGDHYKIEITREFKP